MNHNWNYVTVGYVLSAATLVGYATWIKLRTRRLRRLLRDDNRD